MPAVSNSPEDPLNNPDSSRQVRDADSGRVPTAGPQVRPVREKATKRDNEANDGQNVQFGTPDLDSGDLAGGTLLASNVRDDMRVRWSDIQESFVDDPKRAVANADELVGDAMQRLADVFQKTRHELEEEWDRDESVSTEQLRQALKRYRSFFDKILAT
jgi:hypothetical protein